MDVWFREDVARILAAVAVARGELTDDDKVLLAAICAGFNLRLADVLPFRGQTEPYGQSCVRIKPICEYQPWNNSGDGSW